MWRSTFSTTTIASSTTMPIASTRPNSDSLLSEKPNAAIAANVPISDTGIASSGIRLARQFCRKSSTTSTTSTTASNSVWITASIDSRDEDRRVVDDAVLEALRESSFDSSLHRRARRRRRSRARSSPGRWSDRHRHRGLVVEVAVDRVVARAELDARDVAHAGDAAVGAGLDDDVARTARARAAGRAWSPAAGTRCPSGTGGWPMTPGGDLHVLLAQRRARRRSAVRLRLREPLRDRARRACCTRAARTG